MCTRNQPWRCVWHHDANVGPGLSCMQGSQLPPEQPVAYQKVHRQGHMCICCQDPNHQPPWLFCNSLLHGISKYDTNRLQRLQNKAAKLVFALGRREHVTPLLKDLHWLRMEERIKFKVLLHIYKCLQNHNPSYLKEAMVPYTPGHAGLRSNLDTTRLAESRKAPLVIGDRSFFNAGPRLWNSIPKEIRSAQSIEVFKKQLKTHLFPKSYPDWLPASGVFTLVSSSALWLPSIFH